MSTLLDRKLVRWAVVFAAAALTFAVVFVLAALILPIMTDWLGARLTFPGAPDLVGSLRGLGPVGLAGLAFTGVIAAGRTWIGQVRTDVDDALPPAAGLDGLVDRPEEVDRVVASLLTPNGAATVGITTALAGAGGFGKTTLAEMVCADQRVRQRFRRIAFVTLGRDVRTEAALTQKINEALLQLTGERSGYSTVRPAVRRLSSILDTGPPRLLVIDDAWTADQLEPFLQGGAKCSRLVTTRNPAIVAGKGSLVRVDQMSPGQARALLTRGLTPIAEDVLRDLLAATGRWPLLLHLANRILARAAATGLDLAVAGRELAERLRSTGPTAADELAGETLGADLSDSRQRARTVRATLEASTAQLTEPQQVRLNELTVFAEDEPIPTELVVALWQRTGALTNLEASQLLAQLGELGVVMLRPDEHTGMPMVTMHDVLRDHLAQGVPEPANLHRALVEAIEDRKPWWRLGDHDHYLAQHLVSHLVQAGHGEDAEALATDLRWVERRLSRWGVSAPLADLTLVDTPVSLRKRQSLTRVAHLVRPEDPAAGAVDILHSRLAADPDWEAQIDSLRTAYPRPRLVNRWPLPDTLGAGHIRSIEAPVAAIAPDGSWLLTPGEDTLLIWDTTTWQERPLGTSATAVAVDPAGAWLAVADGDTLLIWDTATWQTATSIHLDRPCLGLSVLDDGRWLALVDDGKLLIHEPPEWRQRLAFPHEATWPSMMLAGAGWVGLLDESGTVQAWQLDVARGEVARRARTSAATAITSGGWMALVSEANHERIVVLDGKTGRSLATLAGHAGALTALAVSPDGARLAAAAGTAVRVWDTRNWQSVASFHNPSTAISSLEFAPNGSWLAVGEQYGEGVVRIWDTTRWQIRGDLRTGYVGVDSITAAPRGEWLAVRSHRSTQIWDVDGGTGPRATAGRRTESMHPMAISPDGAWMATGNGGEVWIWDTAEVGPTLPDEMAADLGPLLGQSLTVLPAQTGWVHTIAIAPDGSWLAAGDNDAVTFWDMQTGDYRAVQSTIGAISAIAIAPQADWVAFCGDENIDIWKILENGELEHAVRLPKRATWVHTAAIAPDGTWLVVSDGWNVTVLDTHTWQRRHVYQTELGTVGAVTPAPDGTWLAVADGNAVTILDTATWATRSTVRSGLGAVGAVVVAPTGGWFATSSGDAVEIWDSTTFQRRTTVQWKDQVISTMRVTPDGTRLAAGGRREYQLWDTETWRPLLLFRVPGPAVHALGVAPDASWLVTGDDRAVRLWDLESRQVVQSFRGHYYHVASVAVAADGSVAATSGGVSDPFVYILDFAHQSLEPLYLEDGGNTISFAAIAPDARWMATSSGSRPGKIQIWDISNLERGEPAQVTDFEAHDGIVQALTITPDGQRLLAAGGFGNGTVRVWHVGSWRLDRRLDAYQDTVNGLAVSPKGDWLAIAGGDDGPDGSVQVWDVASWRRLRTFSTGHHLILGLAIAADGQALATVGTDWTLRVWDPTDGLLLAMMRFNDNVNCCGWIPGTQTIVVGGDSGVYAYDLLPAQGPVS